MYTENLQLDPINGRLSGRFIVEPKGHPLFELKEE